MLPRRRLKTSTKWSQVILPMHRTESWRIYYNRPYNDKALLLNAHCADLWVHSKSIKLITFSFSHFIRAQIDRKNIVLAANVFLTLSISLNLKRVFAISLLDSNGSNYTISVSDRGTRMAMELNCVSMSLMFVVTSFRSNSQHSVHTAHTKRLREAQLSLWDGKKIQYFWSAVCWRQMHFFVTLESLLLWTRAH